MEYRVTRTTLRRVGAVGVAVAAITVTMAFDHALPLVFQWSSALSNAYRYLVGPGLLVLVGVYVGRRSNRPWLVGAGTVLLLWAVMSQDLYCPGGACRLPADYQHWRHLKVGVESGFAGPNLLVSAEPEPCAFTCPYRLQLVPLVFGLGSFATGLLSG